MRHGIGARGADTGQEDATAPMPIRIPHRSLVLPLTLVACMNTTRDEGSPFDGAGTDSHGPAAPTTASGSPSAGDDGVDDGSDGGGPPSLDVGSPESGDGAGEGGECPPLPGGNAELHGIVTAPNGELPISGALVWVQDEPPDGVPDEVYCLECIEVPCDTPHAITGADGSFSLSAVAGSQWLVVSKGQFMRATPIELAAGGQAAASESTRLPNRRAPDEGQWMPNIALAWGDYDALQDALAKLGLGELDGSGQHLAPGTEAFDVWDNHADNFGSTPQNPITTMSMGTLEALVSDADALSKYHIVFVPCASGNAAFTPAQLDNIRAWVAAGGKWYVADWSLAWLDEPFGQYQTFWQDGWSGGPYLDAFDTNGTVLDDGLLAWLDALPPSLADINPLNPGGGHPTLGQLPHVPLEDLWSTIESTPPVLVDDGQGNMIDVGHKVWIEGPGGGEDGAPADQAWPLTVTGEYGCGKILFTSYHTTEWETYVGLSPQELVLMYLILEIGTCQVPLPPPTPAG